ncbi:MAG: hypothetical protein WD275_07325 [Rhodothermales bacterium]
MARRSVLYAAAVISIGLFGSSAAPAQDTVHLRPSFRAEYLPPGTEIVVLSKDAGLIKDGRVQPEFIPVDRYPRERFSGLQKDRLGSRGMSVGVVETSPRARKLYFLYALTPDSTLYWSFSTQRDSLKFDVVSTGVMSVAPITSPEVRSDVISVFFQPRVIVHMPEDSVRSDAASADIDSLDVAGPIAESEPDTIAAQIIPVDTVLPTSPVRDRGFPYGLTFVGLLVLAGSVLMAGRYHREMRRLRGENLSLRARLASLENEQASLQELKS